MSTGARLARGAAMVLGTGYVLVFFSEVVFWSVWRPGDELFGRLMAWLLYSLFGYLTLGVISHFRLRDGAELMLAGAFFGWVCEGVYAMTVFGDPSMPFPLTIVWTAIAWHAPISLLLGWYAMGMALREPRAGPAVLLSLGLGLFWGAWALGWPAGNPPVVASPEGFAFHAAITTMLFALAHVTIGAAHPATYAPSRVGLGIAAALVVGFFAAVTVPSVPIAILVLPPLLGLLWLMLRRCRARHEGGSVISRFATPVRPRNLIALALMPLAASAVYGPLSSGLPPLGFVHPGFALLTSLAGIALFAAATRRALRRGAA